ncbi:probable inactive protein kinase DDB_G0270444 [Passer domesticus]|uniref:probable inactive protein kinase DDB_G0270444 n=1 Tax=Passer domesticus TaxID=48849 RepID=UPI0030FEFC77
MLFTLLLPTLLVTCPLITPSLLKDPECLDFVIQRCRMLPFVLRKAVPDGEEEMEVDAKIDMEEEMEVDIEIDVEDEMETEGADTGEEEMEVDVEVEEEMEVDVEESIEDMDID